MMELNRSNKELDLDFLLTALGTDEALCDGFMYDVGSDVAILSEDKACPVWVEEGVLYFKEL